jgi:Lipocalin-like domain
MILEQCKNVHAGRNLSEKAMIRKWIAGLLVVGFCSLAILFSARVKAADSPNQKLIGTWRLTSFEDRPSSGPVKYPFGRTPSGLLIYDGTGHMSIQIVNLPHPKVASGDEDKITDAEKLALFGAYEAYFGTYTVDWEKHVVTHNVEGDLRDVYIGTAQQRPFELDGDHLSLLPRWERQDGVKLQGVRTFERQR